MHLFRGSVVLVMATSGCLGPSLSSVQATAALGQRIGPFQDALDDTAEYCAKLERLTDGDVGMCGAPDPQWRRAPKVLTAYAGAMARLAGQDDVDVHNQVQATVDAVAGGGLPSASLSPKERGIIAMVADAIGKAATEAYKMEKLKQAILEYDDYVSTSVANLTTVITAQISLLDDLTSQAKATITALAINLRTDGAPPGDVTAKVKRIEKGVLSAYLDDVQRTIEDQRRRLVDYRRTLTLFGKAHNTLHAHAHDFAENDLAIVKTILQTVGSDMGGGSK